MSIVQCNGDLVVTGLLQSGDLCVEALDAFAARRLFDGALYLVSVLAEQFFLGNARCGGTTRGSCNRLYGGRWRFGRGFGRRCCGGFGRWAALLSATIHGGVIAVEPCHGRRQIPANHQFVVEFVSRPVVAVRTRTVNQKIVVRFIVVVMRIRHEKSDAK